MEISKFEAAKKLSALTGESVGDLLRLTASELAQRLSEANREEAKRSMAAVAPAVSRAQITRSWAASDRFPVPEVDDSYINPFPLYTERLEAKSRATGKPRNVALHGPTGSGKTTYAIQFAARFGRPLYILNCGGLVEADQLLGHWEAKDGSTIWVESDLWHAVQVPGCVILLDELNRGANSRTLNTLLEMLDDRRTLGNAKVADGVIFFATLNEGAEYTGTDILDAAIDDRFSEGLHFSYLKNESELLVRNYGADPDVAEKLVMLANNLRGNFQISLRTLRATVEELHAGASIWDAVHVTFGKRVPYGTLSAAMAIIWPMLKPGEFGGEK